MLLQPKSSFVACPSSQPATALHLQVLVDLEHGGVGALGADHPEAEAGEGVVVGQDDDGLHGLGERPGVLAGVGFAWLRSIREQGLKVIKSFLHHHR